jgi:hypothetical protein
MTKPIRIAHDQGFPPFAESKDGRSEGLAVDIFRAAAAQAGLDVKFVPVPFEQRHSHWGTDALMHISLSQSRPNVCNCSTFQTRWLLLVALYLYVLQAYLLKISPP